MEIRSTVSTVYVGESIGQVHRIPYSFQLFIGGRCVEPRTYHQWSVSDGGRKNRSIYRGPVCVLGRGSKRDVGVDRTSGRPGGSKIKVSIGGRCVFSE